MCLMFILDAIEYMILHIRLHLFLANGKMETVSPRRIQSECVNESIAFNGTPQILIIYNNNAAS